MSAPGVVLELVVGRLRGGLGSRLGGVGLGDSMAVVGTWAR